MKPNYDHPLRPQYHFTPEANWLNDPNGMVYYEGEYHLFYQHHPASTIWGPMHWGHAVSKDLVYWEHLPIALYPDHNGTIFSGSAVVDWEDTSGFFDGESGLVAIYTQTEQIPDSGLSKQRQSIAYSKDNGRTWIAYSGNPVLTDERFVDFRDPKVFWHDATKRWIMVLAAGDRLSLYYSTNLKEWTFASEFGAMDGSHDGVWECPDLFPLPVEGKQGSEKWVLIVSIGDNEEQPEGSRTQYFIGDFDGITFTNDHGPDSVLWLDYGRDNYAGVTWSDTQGGDRLLIGWMNNWKYANLIPSGEWRGAMTLPRKLSLRQQVEGFRLIQEVPDELREMRADRYEWRDEQIKQGNNLLKGHKGELFEIEAEFEMDSAVEFGFKLRIGHETETRVGYDTTAGQLFIDRTRSGLLDFHPQFGCRHSTPLDGANGRIKLHIWVDRSSIELFVNDGELVMTDQIFPLEGSDGIELYAEGGNVWLRSMLLYPLKSVYSADIAETVRQS